MKDLAYLVARLKAKEYDDLDAYHAAILLERLTSGDLALPEPFAALHHDDGFFSCKSRGNVWPDDKPMRTAVYTEAQMLDYGARCRADERERIAKWLGVDVAFYSELDDAIRKGDHIVDANKLGGAA